MTIGERIKQKRLEQGLSLEQLANKMGYKSKTSVFKAEQGITDLPLSKVKEFAEVLKTTPSYLMGWDSEPKSWNQLKEALILRNMSLEELSEKAEISMYRLNKLMLNYGTASTTDIYTIAKILNVDEIWLMGLG